MGFEALDETREIEPLGKVERIDVGDRRLHALSLSEGGKLVRAQACVRRPAGPPAVVDARDHL